MIAIGVVFLFGVATTVYLSLRSPETKVPDVVGKNRFDAEKILEEADLNFRVRAYRPSKAQPDTVLFQLPRAGEVVKAGQTVAMDVSRPTKAGESPEATPDESNENRNTNTSANANANENKPKKPKNTNANGNTNANANRSPNANGNANRAANANANRPNANVDNANVTPRSNVNRSDQRNTNSRTNSNENRRPVAPRPTPTVP